MVSSQPETQQPSLDRLDFGRLRRLMADLGLQTGFWPAGSAHVIGLVPEAPLCQRLYGTGGHCQPFLLQLARDAQADGSLQCRSCMPGAFTLAARLDGAAADSPVALGCFLTADLAESAVARQILRALHVDEDGLLARPAGKERYRPQDIAWLTAAFSRIAQEWYTRSCEQAREVEALSESLADTYEELSFIYRLNEAMNLTASPLAYVQDLADELRQLVGADGIVVRLFTEVLPSQAADDRICAGSLPPAAEQLLAEVDMEKLAKRGYQILALPANDGKTDASLAGGKMLATMIVRNGQRLGLIGAVRAAGRPKFNNIDVTRISSIAKSAAVVLENFRLYDNLRQLFLGTVRALTRSIDAKDQYTCGHSERVAIISRRLVLQIGGTEQEAERVYLCGLLHDIGKIGIPEGVLCKAGRLTEEEFRIIKRHPVVGGAILEGIKELEDLVPGVLHHHERVDGRGYPGGLAGSDIPLFARVLAVADTFDAMTSARPYRQAMSVQTAVEEIRRHAGSQFDPQIVEALLELHPEALVEELRNMQSGMSRLVVPQGAI